MPGKPFHARPLRFAKENLCAPVLACFSWHPWRSLWELPANPLFSVRDFAEVLTFNEGRRQSTLVALRETGFLRRSFPVDSRIPAGQFVSRGAAFSLFTNFQNLFSNSNHKLTDFSKPHGSLTADPTATF